MRFIAIDCETTGLDPNTCQMVELAMIHAEVQIDTPPKVDVNHWYIRPRDGQQYCGEDTAMRMNQGIMDKIMSGEYLSVTEDTIVPTISRWLKSHMYGREGFVPCGKNVMGFDMRFLRRLPGWGYPAIKHKHRAIDVGTLMLRPTDECPPDLEECKKRAGIIGGVSHTAIEDAMDCVQIVRRWLDNFNRPRVEPHPDGCKCVMCLH